MYIESNGANGTALRKITAKTESALGLIRRIANRHRGIKEDNLIRIIHAFVLCHLSYSAAMHNWHVAERNKLNSLIRKVFKLALGLPASTQTENLLKLGVHNTLEEIIEAQEHSQLLRLSGTPTGRKLLGEMGLNPVDQCPTPCGFPATSGLNCTSRPFPAICTPQTTSADVGPGVQLYSSMSAITTLKQASWMPRHMSNKRHSPSPS